MNKRIGRFEIGMDMIEDRFDTVVEMFRQLEIIPVRAEALYHKRTIEYIAISPKFREVKQGEITPDYLLEMVDGVAMYRIVEG